MPIAWLYLVRIQESIFVKPWIFSCAVVTPLLWSHSVIGQSQASDGMPNQKAAVDYSQRVSQRPIETYGTLSTRLGSWVLIPGIELEETYDSNIYATERNEENDFITILKPRARLESDWSVHSIKLEVGGDFGFYQDFTDENFEDYYARNRNRIEVVRGTTLIADWLYRDAHVARSSPDSLNESEEPLTYNLLSGTLGLERDIGKLGLRLDVNAENIEYDDSRSLSGRIIDNAYRNYTTVDGGVRLSYKPIPKTEAYLNMRLKDVSYDDVTANNRVDRDSQGYELTVGAKKSLSDLWVLDAYIGYEPSYFDEDSLEDITGGQAFTMGASALWNPTALTSVVGDIDRGTYQTTEAGASAVINTALSLRVEHKLTQSLLLDGSLGYSFADYYGSTREDDNYSAGIGAQYFFSRLVSLRAAYDYYERDSTQAGSSYDSHTASLQIRVNY